MLRMCIFCLIVVGDVINNLLFLWLSQGSYFFGYSILGRGQDGCQGMCMVRFV